MARRRRPPVESPGVVYGGVSPGGWSPVSKHLGGDDVDGDLPRAMMKALAEALMSAQASLQCGAGYGERSAERENYRSGYRPRPWDTRVGSIDLAAAKLRSGVYSPEFLLQPRRRRFRNRPLDTGPYRYLWIDSLVRHEALVNPP